MNLHPRLLGRLLILLSGALSLWPATAQVPTVTHNCIVGGIMDIGDVKTIFPTGEFNFLEVQLTEVPGVKHGTLSRFSVAGEETVWGTYGSHNFGPSVSPLFNQNRVFAHNGLRYVNDGSGLGETELIPIRFQNGPEYLLQIKILPVDDAPQILAHPKPLQTVLRGEQATLTVDVAGKPPLSFQWYEGFPPSTFKPIDGATSSSYTTPAVFESGQYHYWVRVSNDITGVNSEGCTVNVGLAPTAHSGGPYTIGELRTLVLQPSATDEDSVFFAYDWDFDHNNVFGQISTQFGPEFAPRHAAGATFTANGLEGPGTVVNITVRVSDTTDLTDTEATTVTIVNAPPLARFDSDGVGATVSFSELRDSPGDLAAGFKYSYDFNNDGTFEIVDSLSPTATVPSAHLAGYLDGAPVRGRITDRDGGSSDYLAGVYGKCIVVSTLDDENDGLAAYELGVPDISLREAVALAEVTSGPDAILFDPALFTSLAASLVLNDPLDISTPIALCGPRMGYGLWLSGAGRTVRGINVSPTGKLTLNDVTLWAFADPTAFPRGGAISSEGELVLRRSSFINNRARGLGAAWGGAVYCHGGILTAENCTFADNAAEGAPGGQYYGGAIFAHGTTVNLRHCTLSENSAGAGRDLFLLSDAGANASAVINNCILAQGDTAATDFEIAAINGGSLPTSSGSGNLIRRAVGFGGSALSADPQLEPFNNNGGTTVTLLPQRGSLALNRADPAHQLPTDQRGFARPYAHFPDIGAVEFDRYLESLVVTTTVDEEDGTSDPLLGTGTSLREAILYAESHPGADTITFARALAFQTLTLTDGWPTQPETAFSVVGQLTIDGTSDITLQVTGGTPRRHFHTQSGAILTLKNLALTGGDALATGKGGAVLNSGQTVLVNTRIANNTAHFGGGVYNEMFTSLRVTNCVFESNSCPAKGETIPGGGGAVGGLGQVTVINSRFHNNSAPYGGAASIFGQGIVRDTTFSDNHSTVDAGAYHYLGTLHCYGCTFSGNSAENDGGALAGDGNLFLTNSTFTANSAINAGAIRVASGSLNAVHVTVFGNTATSSGGGIFLVDNGPDNPPSTAWLLNTIVAGNVAPASAEIFGALDPLSEHNLLGIEGTGGLVHGENGNLVGLHALDVGLDALGDYGGPTYTLAVLPGSPAIDAGVAVVDLLDDQRGSPRSSSVAPDIGAFESNYDLSDDDVDDDSIPNAEELIRGSSPLFVDTDGDGFNDPTELLAGSNPRDPHSQPPSTYVARVIRHGPAGGLDLQGNFTYAFNLGPTGGVGQVDDANFAADTAPGITVSAIGSNSNWSLGEFGAAPEDDVLEAVFRSARRGNPTASDPELRPLKVDLANLVPGRNYQLQLLFAERTGFAHVFDVAVGGAVLVRNFNVPETQGTALATAIVHKFTATSSALHIEITGEQTFDAYDHDPFLNGLTLEALPTAPTAAADTLKRPNLTRVVKVPHANLLSNDRDPDGDPLVIITVGNAQPVGATVVLNSNFVLYVAPTANAGNGSFTYTISDGTTGHSSSALVTVEQTAVVLESPPNAASVTASGVDIIVRFIGLPGRRYGVQYTPSLIPPFAWNDFSPAVEIVAPPNGVIVFTDPGPHGSSRFYRAVLRN